MKWQVLQVIELVDTPGCMKPSNFGHMISRGKEAYPVSLKQSRLVKVIVFLKFWSNHGLPRWRKFKQLIWFYFCHLFNLFQYPVYFPLPPTPSADWLNLPTSRKRDSERTPGGTMQVVSFKKMRMWTTRRLDITNSRRESGTTFCCLAIAEPEYGGQQLLLVVTILQ